jgi:hypothetical protein
LQQVFRDVAPTGEAKQKSENSRSVSAIGEIEGGGLATTQTGQKLGVRSFHTHKNATSRRM